MALSFVCELPLPLQAALLLVPLYIFVTKSRSPLVPTDWPIVGMLPGLVANRHNIHDYAATVLAASGHNFELTATGVRYLVTSIPCNIRHIFTTSFSKYVKGEELVASLSLLGGTIVAADGESWRRQRETIHRVLTRPRLLDSVFRCCRDKVAEGLMPLLSHMANTRAKFDMEDLLGRLVFDMTVMAVFGTDPCRLAVDMPPAHVAAALDTLMEVALLRQSVPMFVWGTMRWLNVGPERKMAEAEAVLYGYVAENIRKKMAASDKAAGAETGDDDILSHYINDNASPEFLTEDGEPTDFLCRTFINFLVAMRDPMGSALSWFIYNLATNQRAVLAIRKELVPIIERKISDGGGGGSTVHGVAFEPDETKDLVYTRAAMFESLRLYPIAPLERKVAVADDVLPSGHNLRAGDTVLISTYSMGRLEEVWGEDCREYRPERWLSKDGGKLLHVPSHEFMAFNTGPRACLGKNISVALVTSIAATVVWNFDVEVLESHTVKPKLSVILQMKNGLMAKVKKVSKGEVCQ